MRYHRIEKKGFVVCMVERSEADLKKRLVKMGYDGNEEYFFIHKKEHGDSLSKDCWLIFLKGKFQKAWMLSLKGRNNWEGSAGVQPSRQDR
jgi:hypothetical protein